jgi:invasion protein IalB
MRINRHWRIALPLVVAAAMIAPAAAQQPAEPAAPAAGTTPKRPAAKPKPKPKPVAAKPAAPAPVPARPAAARPGAPSAAAVGGPKPTLLGQYGEWGAYMADPGGKKVCFAIAKPTAAETTPPNRPRNPVYMFLSTRPADKVANELSIIAGYPLKAGTEASIEVGSTSYALYTQQDGAWIKNATEEAQLIDAMRQGQTAVVKGVSSKGTQSTDTYSLKGLTQALERTAQDCK